MIDNAINDGKTTAGGGEDMIFAGLYRSLIAYNDHSSKSI